MLDTSQLGFSVYLPICMLFISRLFLRQLDLAKVFDYMLIVLDLFKIIKTYINIDKTKKMLLA